MFYPQYLAYIPQIPICSPEPPADPVRDWLFDALDERRHEAFALQNRLFAAPDDGEYARLKRLLAQNKAAQAALYRDIVQLDCTAPCRWSVR